MTNRAAQSGQEHGEREPVTREPPAIAGEVPALDLLVPLIARWRVVVGCGLAAGMVATVISLVLPIRYTGTTVFVSERGQSAVPAALAGLAGQVGIPIAAEQAWSPRFYVELVRSRALMEKVLFAKYTRTGDSDSTSLFELLQRGQTPTARTIFAALEQLNKDVAVTINPQTNIIRLSVDAADPELAAQVANRFVQCLGEFNTETRQSQARRRREFVEARAAEAELNLRRAEEELGRFYATNRTWSQTSGLVLEEGRLRRQVDLRQELYLTLRRELENARIEEVNDTPVITVLDQAISPVFRSWPRRKLIVAASLLGGLLLGSLVVYLLEYAARRRAGEGLSQAIPSEAQAQF